MGWNIAIKNKNLPQQLDRENLSQLPTEELVNIILEQASATRELQAAAEGYRSDRGIGSIIDVAEYKYELG